MIITIVIVVSFLIGSGIQYFRANRLSTQLEETQHALAFARMEGLLGAATIDAQRQSYETSRQLASEFFTELQQHVDDAPQEAQGELRKLLNERDAMITMLSRRYPESGNVLTRAFMQYRGAVTGRLPAPAAPPDGSAR
jgi:hypothetical protein